MKKRDYIDFDRWVWISLTQKCNWKCWYCDHPKIQNPQTVSLDKFDEFADMFKKVKGNSNIEVSLEGGEIGLLDEKYLDHIFESNLSETYTITTNGTFMKKGYHELYKDKIHHILYHVVPEMNSNYEFPYYNFDESIHVLYTIVVHKNNIHYLNDFLDYNKKYTFLPHFLQPRTENLEFMNKEDFQKIYNIVKDKFNIENHMKKRLLEIIKNIDNEKYMHNYRKICCNFYNKAIINLPKNTIHRCCISMNTSEIELNEKNLEGTLYNKLFTFPKIDNVCTNCIANFVWLYGMVYKRKDTELNNQRILFDILKGCINV